MLESLHPICIMTRTDADVTTLYHSFFLVEYISAWNDIKVVRRIPNDRPKLDVIESGLKIFILDDLANSSNREVGGNFVITSSDGTRYYAVYRCYDHRIFISVSTLPLFTFSRKVFELIECETVQNVPLALLTLCETPIFPAANLRYDLEFSSGVASLKFSGVEQVEDVAMDLVVMNVLNPVMLVKAWESIVLERKVLVVSNVDSIITPCCEYLRRMALPLVIVNTFVPLLPVDLINAVEAPFPYILGGNTTVLRESQVDLSDTVIIDLDTRQVIPPQNLNANPDSHAPVELVARMLNEINCIMLGTMGAWFERPAYTAFSDPNGRMNSENPLSEESLMSKSSKVLHVFVQANLSLISARNCTVRAFFRRPEYIVEDVDVSKRRDTSSRRVFATMGFDYHRGVYSGFMQLSRDRFEEDCIQHFIPCWIEMDDCIFAAYEYADDLPLLYIPKVDIESVSPSPLEPEGHVFEIVLKDQMLYRFTAADSEARRKWIDTLEIVKKKFDKKPVHVNMAIDTSVSQASPFGSITITSCPTNVNLNSTSGRPTTPPSVSSPNNPASGNAINALNGTTDESSYSLYSFESSPSIGFPLFQSQNSTSSMSRYSFDHTNSNSNRTVNRELSSNNSRACEDEGKFRFYFNKTQMMTSLHSQMDSVEFNSITKQYNIQLDSLISRVFDEQMIKYLWTFGTIKGILDQIQKDYPNIKESMSMDPLLTSRSNHGLDIDVSENSPRHCSSLASDSHESSFSRASDLSPTRQNKRSSGRMINFSLDDYMEDTSSMQPKEAVTQRHSDTSPTTKQVANDGFRKTVVSIDATHTTAPLLQQSKSEKGKGRGGSILGSLFSRSSTYSAKSIEEDMAVLAAREMEKERLEQRNRDKEIEFEYQRKVRNKLALISASYRRCQVELSKTIVDNRIDALQEIVYAGTDYKPVDKSGTNRNISQRINPSTGSIHSDNSVANLGQEDQDSKPLDPIRIPLAKILSKFNKPSRIQQLVSVYNGANNQDSSHNSSRHGSQDLRDELSPLRIDTIARISRLNSLTTMNRSKLWHDHIFESLMEKSWEDYKAESASSALLSYGESSSIVSNDSTDYILQQQSTTDPTHSFSSDSKSSSSDSSKEEQKFFDDALSVSLPEETKSSEPITPLPLPQTKSQPQATSLDQEQTIISHIRHHLLAAITTHLEKLKPSKSNAIPVYFALCGFLQQSLGFTKEALSSYANGCLINQRNVMFCIAMELRTYLSETNRSIKHPLSHESGLNPPRCLNELKFLICMYELSPVLGLQTYRLLTEILYRSFILKLSIDDYHLDNSLTLKSFRNFPGSCKPSQLQRNLDGTPSRTYLQSTLNKMSSKADFTWVESDGKMEALNEVVTCVSIDSHTPPCELSIQLLSRVREILRTYTQSPIGSKFTKRSSSGFVKLKIVPTMVEELSSSSAFRAFELQCCQLQKIDIRNLSLNQRVLFFTNIYNAITVHAILAKGSPGGNLLERSSFMRNAKYNIGGMMFSLIDIEHGILRHSSTKPMIFGPFTISITFSDKDPRKQLVIEEAKPNISFCLFSASNSSPPLVVLKDIANLDDEMQKMAKLFLQSNVKLDPAHHSVELPGLMKIYWSDFGGNRAKVLKVISNISGPQFASDLKPYIQPADGVKPKVEFAYIDWTPMIIL